MELRTPNKRLHNVDKELYFESLYGNEDTFYIPLQFLIIGADPGFRLHYLFPFSCLEAKNKTLKVIYQNYQEFTLWSWILVHTTDSHWIKIHKASPVMTNQGIS